MLFSKIIRDPVHLQIEIEEEVIYDLIQTKEMQRMRKIKQLGCLYFSFPGAVHSRFLHSLGVYHISKMFLKQLNPRKNTSRFSNEEQLAVLCAGLLHDVGHGPFSHAYEKINKNNLTHEYYTKAIINSSGTEVNSVLKKHNINLDLVSAIIEKKCSKLFLQQIISSEIDADRMDFLTRDSYFTGATYGIFDREWIIHNCKLINDEIVFDVKAIHAIENYLISRYHMYAQIYSHPLSHGKEKLLEIIFSRAKDLLVNGFSFAANQKEITKIIKPSNLEEYLNLDDSLIDQVINSFRYEKDDELVRLSKIYEDPLKPRVHSGKAVAKNSQKIHRIKGRAGYRVENLQKIKIIKFGKIYSFPEVSFIFNNSRDWITTENLIVEI